LAERLSKDNLCDQVKDKIRKAYVELHRRKVLHRDVKPSNILVSSDKSVYIIDFESAAFVESESRQEAEIAELERVLKKLEDRV
jgi:serine/threonine protein kinase